MISLVNKRSVYYYTTKNSGFQEVLSAEENFVGLYIFLRTVEKSFSIFKPVLLVNAERAAIAALSVHLTCFSLISCINAASSSDLVIVAA